MRTWKIFIRTLVTNKALIKILILATLLLIAPYALADKVNDPDPIP